MPQQIDSSAGAIVVFGAQLAKRLSCSEVRLPPNYIGVRRVRPSTRFVQAAQQQLDQSGRNNNQQRMASSPTVFKILDPSTGEERRMTTQEKRQLKLQLRQKRKLEVNTRKKTNDQQFHIEERHKATRWEISERNSDTKDCYVNLPIDPLALADEIADLRGERDGVPPVVLPSQMTPLFRTKFLPTNDCRKETLPMIDDNLAKKWADMLKKSMAEAESYRQSEFGVRPMPYHLVPEVWKRMRPSVMTARSSLNSAIGSGSNIQDVESWSYCEIRPTTANYDRDVTAILQVLCIGTSLQLSCGSKFGCDYLLYDGPRHERHAFAGLRVVAATKTNSMTVPTAYDLSGFVRCLNTAGKLALLASVVHDDLTGKCCVIIVDLALEKIMNTTSQRPKKSMEWRYQKLAKK